MRPILGKGNLISFWKHKWASNDSFKDLFPSLFEVAKYKHGSILEQGYWLDNTWFWDLQWSRDLSEAEKGERDLLLDTILPLHPVNSIQDCWRWRLETYHSFSVKSCYILLLNLLQQDRLDNDIQRALIDMWHLSIPTKVGVFGWRLFLGKLPTRDNLISKGIINDPNGACCPFCFEQDESISHLFFLCRHSRLVWLEVQIWSGLVTADYLEGVKHFRGFGLHLDSKKACRLKYLIWMAVTWCIWIHRNHVVFRGRVCNPQEIVNHVKSISWTWFISIEGRNSNFSISDWWGNPSVCMNSV